MLLIFLIIIEFLHSINLLINKVFLVLLAPRNKTLNGSYRSSDNEALFLFFICSNVQMQIIELVIVGKKNVSSIF